MRKSNLTLNSREWAMQIVSFARSQDETRYNLAGYNLELNRVVATDGHRLAWQEFGPMVPESYHGLVNAEGKPAEGQFPDYKDVLPGLANIVFHVSSDGDRLPVLKTMAKLSKLPYGELAYDGNNLTVSLTTTTPVVECTLTIPVAAGDPKPFKLGINIAYLWDALDAARRSDTRGRWYARIAIVDHMTAVTIDNTNGFYSVTMPLRCEGAFTTKPKRTKEEAKQAA